MVESVHTGFFNLFQNLTVLFVSHRQHDHRNVCGEFYSFTVQFAKGKPQGVVKIITMGFILISGESGGQAFLH